MSTPIYPMAMIPKTNMIFKLYFLAFPEAWKAEMLKLQLTVNPKFNTVYPMNTRVLYDYLNGWLEDVVQIRTIKKDSEDTDWFISMKEPDTEKICEILQIWIAAKYMQNPKTKEMAEHFMDIINSDVLKTGIRMEETVLFDEKRHALADYAFNAFALYAANALKSRTITVFGQKLTFSNCGSKELISQPISDGNKNPHYYAIGLQLSLQTTPPERSCMLLIDCSVKRFVSNAWKKNIYLKEDIHAYISMEQNKYRRITLHQRYEKDEETGQKRYPHFWSLPEQKCYNLYNINQLPDADDVLYHPEQYIFSDVQILLPYKYGMDFTNMRIGTGVPIKDKSVIFSQICNLMQDFAEPVKPAQPINGVRYYKKMQNAEGQKLHRERLKSCTGMPALTIEIYGHDSDNLLCQQITDEFENYLGGSENDSIFSIHLVKKELGVLGDMMEDSTYGAHCQRIKEVTRLIPKSETIIGAIVILPDTRDEAGDPKHALRAGFADTNRLTQFITPDGEESSKSRVHGAVMDILRQFGYSEFIEKKNMQKNPAFDADAVGMHVMHQLKPLWAKTPKDTARFLPVYITYQVRSGKILVDCDIFERRHLSYPEALLEFSRLSRDENFTKLCSDAVRSGLRTKLLGLQSLYREKASLIMIQANGIIRQLWHGITDKIISEYHIKEEYIPEKIDIGTKAYPDMKDFGSTAIRIIRVRENQSTHEVPDYYTEQKESDKHISSSGIYQYRKVFWALEGRPKSNPEYWKSYQQSKFESPTQSFDECGLVEFFPIQLQQGDQVTQWVAFSNYLREVMPETNRQSVRLPAPLHFAELMKEYLLLDSHKK